MNEPQPAEIINVLPFPPLSKSQYDWEGEDVLPSWSGFQERQGAYTSRSSDAPSQGRVQVYVEQIDDGELQSIAGEQVNAYRYLKENESEITALILQAIFEYHHRLRELWAGQDEPLPVLKQPEELRDMIGLGAVHVLSVAKDGSAYIGFEFGCDWDDEHGSGVMTHRNRVLEVGQADTSFDYWIAKEDGGESLQSSDAPPDIKAQSTEPVSLEEIQLKLPLHPKAKKKLMFLLTYFRTGAEALHYALSEDGLHWRALNGNRPVLHSTVGARSIRDPFVMRDHNGLLHALSSNSWQSQSIWYAVSDDLIEWHDEKLLPVMASVPRARNAWAPEAFFDAEAGLYRLIWASATSEPNDADDGNHHIWSASTSDWQEFSSPELFFDPGFSVIDACVVRESSGKYLMTFKDERAESTLASYGKAICLARGARGNGPWIMEEKFIVPAPVEGPTMFWREDAQLGAGWTLFYDFFMATGFGAAHCSDGHTWHDITAHASFPAGPRHGAVLRISSEEAARLERHFGS